jgi:phosphate transport system substrate-binding protein
MKKKCSRIPCAMPFARRRSFAKLPVLLAGAFLAGPAFAAAPQMTVSPNLPSFEPQANAGKPPEDAAYLLPDHSIHIAAAKHARFILEGFGALFEKAHPGIKFALDLKGTTTAIPALTYGSTPFAPMGRAVSALELVPYKKIVGMPPLEIRVAHASNTSLHAATSLAVYVNQANPIDKISMEEIARIFSLGNAGGEFSRWGQLGEDGEWANAPIHPAFTPEYTGFGSYLERTFLNHRPFAAAVEKLPNTKEILKYVGEDGYAIGIAAIGRTAPGIKMIALSQKPGRAYSMGSQEDVVNGKYPLVRYLYFYIRQEPGKPLDPFIKEYFRLILSKEGQEIIASEPDGYLPLTPEEVAQERAKLENFKFGDAQ